MTELDLLSLARSTTQNEISYFAQMITINFAMIVAIYYFLSQARLAMKLFAFVAYMIGMLLFFGQILLESNIKLAVLNGLHALPNPSPMTAYYLGLYDSWLTKATAVLFNGAIWVLCLGVFYLLFFWKKSPEERDVRITEIPR